MLKNICLFAIGLVAAVSIGCSGAAPPTQGNVEQSTDAAKAANAAATKVDTEADPAGEDASSAMPAGNKGSNVPRLATPPGTPNQQ